MMMMETIENTRVKLILILFIACYICMWQQCHAVVLKVGDKVSFFKIPTTINQIETDIKALGKQLAAMPTPSSVLLLKNYGYHGGYLPGLEQLPEKPRWTIDVKLSGGAELQKVIIIPSMLAKPGGKQSYGFPKRMRVSQMLENGDVIVAKEWMAVDCPAPNGGPLIIDMPRQDSHKIRIEVFRGAKEDGKELLALSEIYCVANDIVFKAESIEVSSEYRSLPYWGKEFLIDHKTNLGLPLESEEVSQGNPHAKDFLTSFAANPKQPRIIELDLGENKPLGWLTFYPASPPNGIMIPGYGFPGKITVEVIKENAGGERGAKLPVRARWDSGNPGNNVVLITGQGKTGRWVRIKLSKFPLHNGSPVFGMAEIRAYKKGVVYHVEALNLEGFPAESNEDVRLLYDEKVKARPVMSLLPWLDQLAQAERLSSKRDMLLLRKAALESRWNNVWKITIYSAILVTVVIMGLLIMYVIYQKRRSIRRLRRRITRDLHDEVGSSLAAISLGVEQLKGLDTDQHVEKRLGDISLMASESYSALREVVFIIDQSTISLSDLVRFLSERSSIALGDIKVSVSLEKSYPSKQVSLYCKRHIIMAFKEILHNCARHADATGVELSFLIHGGSFVILFKDNGRGFNINASHDGWGLKSVKKRAQELEGTVCYSSEIGVGCKVTLSIPIAKLDKKLSESHKKSY